ncbi:MAG: EFR1 family ferrodoxin [Bacillota bacterium]
MDIKSIKLVCFSPTGTSKTIVQGVAKGISLRNLELIDITNPGARAQPLQVSENELLVVAVPVYMGRVPALINAWLNSIKACNTPVVCIVTYGNRAYENALLELKDILISRGCKLIAGGAFIAEHSFSSPEFPSSVGRPDEDDLSLTELFGQKIAKKLLSILSIDQISDINIPGSYPYGGVTELWKVDFIEVSDTCLKCGICSEGCPAGAIDSENSSLINIEKCTLCCACIKHCPREARTIKPGPIKEAQKRCAMFIERKEPEFFL